MRSGFFFWRKVAMDNLATYYNHIGFIICALLGGVAHYLKKVIRKETDVGIHEWFGTANLPASIYTLLVFIFVVIGALAGDIVNAQTGFWAALYTGFATGFAIDSGINADDSVPMSKQLLAIKQDTGALFTKPPEPTVPQEAVVQQVQAKKTKRVDL